MRDLNLDKKQRLSVLINGVASQLQKLSAQRLSATGPLSLNEESTKHLLGDLESIYRRALELEAELSNLQRSHQRIARISGIYDVPRLVEKRRAGFAVVAGTDHAVADAKSRDAE